MTNNSCAAKVSCQAISLRS